MLTSVDVTLELWTVVRWFRNLILLASLELVTFLLAFDSFHRRLVTIVCEFDASPKGVGLIW
jgi:hypothetical protein